MKNTLYTQIKNHNKINFNNLLKLNEATIQNKQDLGNLLKELEHDGKIMQYNNFYYDLSTFPDLNGFIQWNLTGFCWLAQQDCSNQYGISFDNSEKLLPIYNKKNAPLGHNAHCKKVLIDGNEFAYVTSHSFNKPVYLIAHYSASQSRWTILNSNYLFSFSEKEKNIADGAIALFQSTPSDELEYIKLIGNIKDYGIESKILLLLADLKKALPNENLNFDKVTDFLDKPFFTIDSITTEDLDDAIWIEKGNNNKGYTLYVAISDVSSYVKPYDLQDNQAQETCATVYLPHTVLHMLDTQLAKNQCSLHPGEAKQVLVCQMNFDDNGTMLDKTFYQTKIISHARMTYEDVNLVLQNEIPKKSTIFINNELQKISIQNEKTLDYQLLSSTLHLLQQFSQTQNTEQRNDYWFLENIDYSLKSDGKIAFLHPQEDTSPSQKMVEVSMLVANMAAADFLQSREQTAGIYRNQVEPQNGENPKASFYDLENTGHWGLNTKSYTHFTSPIRRYCDLLVHRLIKNELSQQAPLYSQEELEKFIKQINFQQYKNKQLDLKIKNLLFPQYFESLVQNQTFDEKLSIVDFNQSGLVCRNKQFIEFFIPNFKLGKDFSEYLKKLLPDDALKVDEKKYVLEKINQDWLFFVKPYNISWCNNRQDLFFQIKKRKLKNNLPYSEPSCSP